jgi:FkbM family methyltransferase
MLPKVNIFQGVGSLRYLLYENTDDQGISGVIKAHQAYEPNLQVISSAIINNNYGDLILDIGANLGSYSIPLANKFSQKKFVLFEPQRIIFYQLCGNIFLNSLNNINALNMGLGRANDTYEATVSDYLNDHNIGAYSLSEEIQKNLRGPNLGSKEIISISKLDNFNYSEICLIKIDVEGMELDVLYGGVGTLFRNNYPPIIYEAWDFDWYAEERNKLQKFLIDLGYVIFKFDKSFNYLAQHPKRGKFLSFK